MSARSALLMGRAAAERYMFADTVRLSRTTGQDEVTGAPTTAPYYEGRGRVQTYEPTESSPNVAEGTVAVQRYSVHIPVGSCDPRPGDVVDVLVAAYDPQLTGRRYVVRGLLHKSYATAQRLMVEDANNFNGGAP